LLQHDCDISAKDVNGTAKDVSGSRMLPASTTRAASDVNGTQTSVPLVLAAWKHPACLDVLAMP
jgi:hypothetical protein